MNRRLFLQYSVFGCISTTAGCLGNTFPDSTGQPGILGDEGSVGDSGGDHSPDVTPPVSGIEINYPRFASYYSVRARRVEGPESTPIPFEDISAGSRLELANAVSRDRYLTGRSDILRDDLHREVISYKGSPFDVGVGVADIFEPEHGPRFDPDWTDPVALAASVDGDDLTVAVTNELDTELAVHHYGRPYFGVLLAVNGTPSLLDHDRYEDNEYIHTAGIPTTERISREDTREVILSPGESLEETYSISDGLRGESTIWLSLLIGDDSIDLFGNRPTTMTATITLET